MTRPARPRGFNCLSEYFRGLYPLYWPMRISKPPATHAHVWTRASRAREMTWSRADLTWRLQ